MAQIVIEKRDAAERRRRSVGSEAKGQDGEGGDGQNAVDSGREQPRGPRPLGVRRGRRSLGRRCRDDPELVNLQDVGGEAKPYQIRQVLRLVERYNLQLEDRS